MINIVIESGGCQNDIFEGKGEMAGVVFMWLLPPLHLLEQLCQIKRRSALAAAAFPRLLSPAKTICSVLCYSRVGTEEFVLWEACTAEDHKPQSE